MKNNTFKKTDDCLNCKHYTLVLQQEKRYHWIDACRLIEKDIFAQIKNCKGIYFEPKKSPKPEIKILKFMNGENANKKYLTCYALNNFKEIWDFMKNFLIERNIKFNGSTHQNGYRGTPIIEYDGKPYAFSLTLRRWGLLMAEAFRPNDKDPLAYTHWAFGIPEGEEPTAGWRKDPLKFAITGDKHGTE